MEDRFYFKIWFSLGLVLALVVLAFSPVFAYDDIEVDHSFIWHRVGADGYNGTPFYTYNEVTSPQYTQHDVTDGGLLFSIPVPKYSDGDHVSIYFNVTLELREIDINRFNLGFFISPSTDTDFLAPSLGVSRLRSLLDQYTYYYSRGRIASKINYTFTLWGDTTCTENVMYSLYKEYPTDEYIFFNAQGILDINVTYPTDESRPIYLALAAQTIPQEGSLDITYRGSDIRVVNTQFETEMLDLLTDIDDLLNQLDLHADLTDMLVDLDSISSRMSRLDSNVTAFRNAFSDYQDALLDDDDPDPQLTEWAGQASEFESKNDLLHQLEESLEGTIEDFEFPTAADQTAVNNVIGYFFSNELVLALTLSCMALMIVFLIL